MKEQIEEMARVIQDTWLPRMEEMDIVGELRIGSRDADRIATNIYNTGYRKQKEGEWLPTCDNHPLVNKYECSCCREESMRGKYCPNCGAKMKGGEANA